MLEGLDCSHHQGAIDWSKVAAAGKSFVFAKATQGDYYTDPDFAGNRARAKAAGLLVGAYHFFDPRVPPVAQAEHFKRVVGAIPDGELIPALDFESLGNKNGLTGREVPKDQAIHDAVIWLVEVEKGLGRHPCLYSYPDFIRSDLGDTHRFSGNPATGDPGWPLWIARYGTASPRPLPGGWSAWTFWQYTSTGRCPGVTGNTDLNRFNGGYPQLLKFVGC